MRIHDDVRKLVAFLGVRTTNRKGEVVPRFGGTGFFVSYPAPSHLPNLQFSYLVTARHVVDGLGGPFVIGVNDVSGTLELSDVDDAAWHYHWDDNVDKGLCTKIRWL